MALRCVHALAAACVGGAVAAPAGAAGAQAAPQRLSDERTVTRWATAVARMAVRERLDPSSRTLAELRFLTEDRRPEIYLALEQRADPTGVVRVRVRLPGRPNGRTGWVRRDALSHFRRTTLFMRVDRSARTATLLRGRRVLWRSRVGVGKRGMATPTGRFYVRQRIRNLAGNPIYGPVAFGTSAYSRLSDWPGGGVIGIHGTNAPQLLPGRVSHGCVRVPNRAIRRLARLLELGTPVLVTDHTPER